MCWTNYKQALDFNRIDATPYDVMSYPLFIVHSIKSIFLKLWHFKLCSDKAKLVLQPLYLNLVIIAVYIFS